MESPDDRIVDRHGLREELASLIAADVPALGLIGAAGIGKTLLVSAVVWQARQTDEQLDVVTVEADELDREVAFRPLSRAFPEVPLAPPVDAETHGDGADPAFGIATRFLDAMAERAGRRRTLVVFEDVHWADEASVLVARMLTRRAPALGVTLLFTTRPTSAGSAASKLVSDAVRFGGRCHVVPPLDDEGLTALTRSITGASPDPQLREYLRSTGGNPLFTVELLRALHADGTLHVSAGRATVPDLVGLPPTLHMTVLRRVSFLPEQTIQLLRLASVLGRTFRVRHLAALAGSSPATVAATLEPAFSSGVLADTGDRARFSHDALRTAIYEDLPVVIRRELHVEAERVLRAVDPDAAVEHLLLGLAPGDPHAPSLLLDAATRLGTRSQRAAVPVLERALEECGPAEPLRAAIVGDLANALVHVGEPERGLELARRAVAAGAPGASLGRLHNAIQAALVNLGQNRASAEAAERAAGIAALSDAERCAFLARGAAAWLQAWDLGAARRLAAGAAQLAPKTDDPYALALTDTAAALLAVREGDTAAGLRLAAAAVATAEQTPSWRSGFLAPYRLLAKLLIDEDDFTGADEVARAGMTRAEAAGNVPWLVHFHTSLGTTRFLRGDLDGATAEVDAAVHVFAGGEGVRTDLIDSALTARVATMRGDLDRAARAIRTGEETLASGGSGAGIDWFWHAQAAFLEATGEHRRALSVLRDAQPVVRLAKTLLDAPLLVVDYVRLARSVEREQAAEAAAWLGRVAEEASRARFTAGAQQCAALLEQDPDPARAATAHFRRAGRLVDLARACEDAADVLAARGDRGEAKEHLEEALRLYDGMDAVAEAARVRASLRGIGVARRGRTRHVRPVEGWQSLTDTERRVADLVAKGLTNREVAERLYVSPRTVETHLSRVFTKLRLRSRSQLAAVASERREPDQVAHDP